MACYVVPPIPQHGPYMDMIRRQATIWHDKEIRSAMPSSQHPYLYTDMIRR